MTPITPEVWARLSINTPLGETLSARLATPDISKRLLAGIDGQGRRHFLLLLLEGENEIEDRQSRGVHATTRQLTMPDHSSGIYLDITCLDAAGYNAFDLIGGEIASRLATGREAASEVVSRTLAKWRRFWGQAPAQMLSRNEQLGLFAELWFLSRWLSPRAGPAAAVERWRGPSGGRHDFQWSERSVEVKATTSVRGLIHHINGLEQLAPPEDGLLFFFSLRMREEANAAHSLPSLIENCRSLIDSDGEVLSRFESALAQAGYSPAHEPEYGGAHWRVVEQGLFKVEDEFPRLTPISFADGLPIGVERVEYEINLDTAHRLLIANTPESGPSDW